MTTADAPSARRAELGQFLRARRAQLSPEELGLPPGARRRTPGLRREEVAMLAGVGFTWYTWLEQGRSINVSSHVLDSLARTLRLDSTGRWHLYQLAEATPSRAGVAATVVPDEVYAVLRGLDPLPAVLINARFDVVAFNDAHADLLVNWHTLPCVHKNMLWCHLTEPTARQKMLNYDEEIPYAVARLRASYAQHIGDPEWDEDIRRLAQTSKEFAHLWARHELAAPEARVRRLRHAEVGQLNFRVSEFDVSTMPGLRIEVFTPADTITQERLPRTRRDLVTDIESHAHMA